MSKTNMTKSVNPKAGFTLLEILLVVGIIAILAGIVILAINPTKQLADARNAQRRSDVLTILNGIYQYSLDNNGVLDTIAGGSALVQSDTCDATGTDAIDLETTLVGASSTYLTAIPHDPQAADGDIASEYFIVQRTNGRVTVCIDPANEENSISIEVTR
jgi:prepilin-type N-terminal cleavage/methylation domain-containing protein